MVRPMQRGPLQDSASLMDMLYMGPLTLRQREGANALVGQVMSLASGRALTSFPNVHNKH